MPKRTADAGRFSPRNFLRARRPEKFSDSVIKERGRLDRALLEYHLDTLTNRGEENRFETFARKLAEREIAPNLLPHTGPTGGGDSKVDSETYPVAEELSQGWYFGETAAASERWAFAFSAKKDWRSKVQSDIPKLVKTGRNYKRAYFVSNQFIRDKDRAEVEDSLGREFGLDVRILDRTWILDRVFDHRHEELAISELGLAVSISVEARRGPLDIQREQDLDDIETKIQQALQGTPGLAYVDDCLESALLARGLERSRVEIDGRFARAQRAADQYGTAHQRVVAYYQQAWATFWWFEDLGEFLKLYSKLEELAKDSRNPTDLEFLANLWTLLASSARRGDVSEEQARLVERTEVVKTALSRLVSEEGRPSAALKARSDLARIQLICEVDSPSKAVFRELQSIVEASEGFVGYPLLPLTEIISELGSFVSGNAAYDALFESVVQITAKRKGEVAAARLLLKRGAEQLDADRPYDAIKTLGRALADLYKHESRHLMVRALYLCASAYERVGLLWAARGTLLNAASVATNEWWSYSEVNPAQAACYNRLKWVELQLGRVPHVLAWHQTDRAVRSVLATQGFPADRLARGEVEFDAILGMLFLRCDLWQLKQLERLPSTLDKLGLYSSSIALSYALGHEEEIPEDATTDSDETQALFERLSDQPAAGDLPESPSLCETATLYLQSVVLGCRISVKCHNQPFCIDLAESLLAAIESLLSTSLFEGIMPRSDRLDVVIRNSDFIEPPFTFELRDVSGLPVVEIRARKFDEGAVAGANERRLKERLVDLVTHILARAFFIGNLEHELKRLFGDERGLQRAIDFTGSFGRIANVLGTSPRLRIEEWLDTDAPPLTLIRTEEWDAERRRVRRSAPVLAPAIELKPGEGDTPEELRDRQDVKHSQVVVSSLIREALWNDARWKAVGFVTSLDPGFVPIMSLGFENGKAGAEIFQHWTRELGQDDSQDRLRVSIIRGIDRANPHHYRVVVGTNPKGGTGTYLALMSKIHTMTPESDLNLRRFTSAYALVGRYLLTAAQVDIKRNSFEGIASALLKKKGLIIRDAWEVGRNDIESSGILPDDEVIIPAGRTDAPVLELLKWKNDREQQRGGSKKRSKKRAKRRR